MRRTFFSIGTSFSCLSGLRMSIQCPYKRNTCRTPRETQIQRKILSLRYMKTKKRWHNFSTEFLNPLLDRSLSVHVITCNTVWQIPKSRCPSILSACAALREVCSHEEKGVSQIPHTRTATITSAD